MTKVDPIWDVDLIEDEYKRLHAEVRSHRCLTALQRKIEFLESNERNGEWVQLSLDNAKNLTRLRNWKDVERGLWPWSDPQFVKKAENKALMDRWEKAIELLSIRRDGGSHKEELDQKDAIIAALKAQVDQLIAHNRLLQKKFAHLAQR